MTVKGIKKANRGIRLSADPASVALGALSLFSLLLIFKNPDIAITHMSSALRLCARTLIPSLFPFMVLSELMVSGNAVSLIAPLLRRPAKALFGISGEGGAAVLLGLVCGFPIGAKTAAALYKKGSIGKRELTHILTFSNNPSSAFLISAVGASMFDDRPFGVLLFAISTLTALIVGFVGKFINRPHTDSAPVSVKGYGEKPPRAVDIFTGAVTSSALSMLSICAFVVFFSTLVGVLEYTVNASALPEAVSALWFGFFELTSGVWKASSVPTLGPYLAAAAVGWSGLSVHFQIMSICRGCDISFKPYLLSKLASAILNVLLLILWGCVLHFL